MTDSIARRLAVLAGAAILAGCTTVLLPPNITPVVAPSKSVAEASRKLEEVAAERKRVEAEYAASEQVCYAKFFVNNCLDTAKEKRRSALVTLNAIEDEAEYYKRKADVDERDREVAKAVKQFEADEAARAAAPPPPPPRVEAAPQPKAPKPTLAARKAAQAARIARHEAEQAAKAPARAAKAKELEALKAETEARQKQVEEKKAEKAAAEKK